MGGLGAVTGSPASAKRDCTTWLSTPSPHLQVLKGDDEEDCAQEAHNLALPLAYLTHSSHLPTPSPHLQALKGDEEEACVQEAHNLALLLDLLTLFSYLPTPSPHLQVLEGADEEDRVQGVHDLALLLECLREQLGVANFEFCQGLLQVTLQVCEGRTVDWGNGGFMRQARGFEPAGVLPGPAASPRCR